MNKYDLQDTKMQNYDPLDSYFECIVSCEINDGICLSECVQKLKDYEIKN